MKRLQNVSKLNLCGLLICAISIIYFTIFALG